jgi:hypothetical protein
MDVKRWVVGLCLFLSGVPAALAVSSQPAASCPANRTVNAAFEAWVRIELRDLPDSMLQSAVVKAPQTILYVNKIDHSQYLVMKLPENEVRIRYFSGSSPTIAEYDSRTKTLLMGVPDPVVRRSALADIEKYPMTLADVKQLIRATGADIVQETQSIEDGLARTDILYMGGTSCAQAKDEGVQDTVWISPADGQIRKLITRLGAGSQIDYSPVKAIETIYDVGVPRSAKVIDSRPTASAAVLLDRISQRADKDFGNYTAVLTETDIRKSWGTRKMFLSIFSRQEDCFLYLTYSLQDRDVPDSPFLKLKHWPSPDLREVLDLASTTAPLCFYAFDGRTVWSGGTTLAQPGKPVLNERSGLMKDIPILQSYRLTSHLWKGYRQLGIYGFGPAADTIIDAKHPNLIGLRLRTGDFKAQAKEGDRRIEKIFWIDPKRDDLPREATVLSERFGPDGHRETTRFLTQYLEFDRTSSGLWYPWRWTTKFTRTEMDGSTEEFSREYNLQISSKTSLDADWFGSRKAALKQKK